EPGKSDPINARPDQRPTGSTATTVCVRSAASTPSQMPAVLQRRPSLPPTSSARSRVCWPLDGVPGGQAVLGLPPRPGQAAQTGGQPAALAPARARPTPQIPPRGLRRYWVIDALTERRDAREGLVARLPRELLRGCRDLR